MAASVRPRKNSARVGALKLRSVDNSRLIAGCELDRCIVAQHQRGLSWLNVRRHQKYKSERICEAQLSRSKARKAAKAAKALKRTVAKAKAKPAPVKKAARK